MARAGGEVLVGTATSGRSSFAEVSALTIDGEQRILSSRDPIGKEEAARSANDEDGSTANDEDARRRALEQVTQTAQRLASLAGCTIRKLEPDMPLHPAEVAEAVAQRRAEKNREGQVARLEEQAHGTTSSPED